MEAGAEEERSEVVGGIVENHGLGVICISIPAGIAKFPR